MNPLRAALARWRRTVAARAWTRYGSSRGGLLAGGMAFAGFFSLFPALVLGVSVFGRVINGHPVLQQRLATRVNDLTGIRLIGTLPGEGVVSFSDLVQTRVLTLTGVIGLALLVVAGLAWLDATREGIRAVAGLPPRPVTVPGRLRDLGAAGLIGLAVLVSAAAGIAVVLAAGRLLRWLDLQDAGLGGALAAGGSNLVLIITDGAILLVLIRVLARVRLPIAELWPAAALGGAGLQVLTLSGGLLLHRVSSNPLLAASSVLAGLLVYMGIAARLTLLSAALGITMAEDRLCVQGRPVAAVGDAAVGEGAAGEGEGSMSGGQRQVRGRSDAARRRVQVPGPAFGPRSQDRVTLAAGIVLGAVGLMLARVLSGAARTLRDLARRR